jgi:mono/diheme cytochrome c family protein
MPLLALLIFITGHLGGSLTHGEDYLTKGFSTGGVNNAVIKPIPNVQQAVAYNDIIQPILQSRCYNCHGPNKQKGKLRLDEPAFIDKGGKDGKILTGGNAGESEMIKRLLLPLDNEDHMPPKEKSQLTKAQIELLNWWVNSGADYHKKVTELNQPEKVKPYLTALQNGGEQKSIATTTDIPEKTVDKAPDDVIQKLKALDVAVNTVSQSSNYLQVNFVAVDSVTTQQLQLLKELSKQIVWLKMGNTKINDTVLSTIGSFRNLTRLFLDRTNITDRNIAYLKTLSQLQYLNLSGTAVTANGLSSLKGLTDLKNLFLYQTNILPGELSAVQKTFSKAVIDTGGYRLEFLATDTIEVKENAVKK